jgi:hypothetical protein
MTTQHRRRRAAGTRRLIALAVVPLVLACAPAGSWTVANPPADPAAGYSTFADVSCPTDTACVAAGPGGSSPTGITTAAWDGAAWTTLPPVPLPAVVGNPQQARGIRIDCAAPADCALVADVLTTSTLVPLLAHWDGTAWSSTAATPTLPDTSVHLADVACGATGSCLAVGLRDAQTGELFAQRWDGAAWTEAPPPPPEPDLYRWQFQLRLSCASASACAFLTEASFPDVRTATSVHLWNGTGWTATPAPIPPAGVAALTDIDCPSATSCMAAGWRLGTGAIAMRWDGTRWTSEAVSTALPLAAVSCADQRCLAIGTTTLGTGLSTTATVAGVARTATGWRVTSSAAADASFSAAGVSCTGSGCVVVGSRTVDDRTGPAALRYRFPANPPV